MPKELIRQLILKHFTNFQLGMTGKYHNVAFEDLEKLVEDVVLNIEVPSPPPQLQTETRGLPSDQWRLSIAGQILSGLVTAKSSDTICAAKALGAAEVLILEHVRTKGAFLRAVEAASMESTYASTP